MNLFITQSFVNNIKSKQPSSPLAYLSSYITLVLYIGFLFAYTEDLPPRIEIFHLTILWAYAGSDWLMLLLSWCIQSNIISRKNALLKFKAGGITQEKKEDDLFDVRYLPEEYMSDV